MDVVLFSHGILLLEQQRTKVRPTAVRRQRSSPPPAGTETWPPSSSLPFERSSSCRSPSQPDLPRALPHIHSRHVRPPSSPEHHAAGRCSLPPTRADRVKEDALQRAPPPGHPAIPARPPNAKAISPAAQAVLILPRPCPESPAAGL